MSDAGAQPGHQGPDVRRGHRCSVGGMMGDHLAEMVEGLSGLDSRLPFAGTQVNNVSYSLIIKNLQY
jgi:hypothetical protein